MIRAVKENDLSAVMQIWLDINIKAHSFISKHYWMDNYDMVKKILPQAEIYVYENNGTKEIEGFIGLTDNYIAGLFVKEDMQSKGIGKQLLLSIPLGSFSTPSRVPIYLTSFPALTFLGFLIYLLLRIICAIIQL